MPSNKKHSNQLPPAGLEATDGDSPEKWIGSRIKSERERLGLNFEQLAALTKEYDKEGIAPVTLRRYERDDEGRSSPGNRELRILCDSLGVTADYLLLGRRVPEYEQRDHEDWELLKGIISRAADPMRATNVADPRATDQKLRQEKLQRARLHTKTKSGE